VTQDTGGRKLTTPGALAVKEEIRAIADLHR